MHFLKWSISALFSSPYVITLWGSRCSLKIQHILKSSLSIIYVFCISLWQSQIHQFLCYTALRQKTLFQVSIVAATWRDTANSGLHLSIYPFIHFSVYPCCCTSLILRWGLHYKKGLSRYRWITWLTAGEGAGCEPQSCCDASHCWGTAHPNRSTLCIAKGILNFKFPWNQDPHKIKL